MNNNLEGLTRYIEYASGDHRLIKKADSIELKESLSKCPKALRIQESLDSEAAAGWWVPISFYNKLNGNNRNYSKKLWENVINNQRDTFVGSGMLTDHPQGDSDGSPKDICGVWLDAKIAPPNASGSGLVYGLLVPCGRNGEDLKDCLSKGLKIGTSSSGFGKLMQDGVTVDPDTYVIERLADWVLNPSQGTFFSYDESSDEVTDKSLNESQINTKVQELNAKESIVKDSKIAKLEEKKFRRDMESFLESANNIKDPQERLEEFKEIKSYLEDGACPDLREQIESKIVEEEAFIKKAVQEKLQLEEELDISSPKDLKEKLTRMSEDVNIIKSESDNWKTISEKLQSKYDKARESLLTKPTRSYARYLERKSTGLSNQLLEQNKRASEVVLKMIESFNKLKEENTALKNKISNLETDKAVVETSLEESKKFKEFASKADSLNRESYVKLEGELREAHINLTKLYSLAESQRTQIEESSKKIEKLKVLNERKTKMLYQVLNEARNSLSSNKLEESAELNEVEEYYESLYQEYGKQIVPFKEKITKSINLTEAKQIFFKDVLQNMKESVEIENLNIPKAMYVTSSDRQNALGLNSIKKSTVMDRKPKGWL